jgi:hypothetical protein
MAVLNPVEVLFTAESSSAATMTRKQRALDFREINRNNIHTVLASVLTYYRFFFLRRESVERYLQTYLLEIFRYCWH